MTDIACKHGHHECAACRAEEADADAASERMRQLARKVFCGPGVDIVVPSWRDFAFAPNWGTCRVRAYAPDLYTCVPAYRHAPELALERSLRGMAVEMLRQNSRTVVGLMMAARSADLSYFDLSLKYREMVRNAACEEDGGAEMALEWLHATRGPGTVPGTGSPPRPVNPFAK